MWSQKATIDLHFTLVSSRFPRNRNSNGVLCWCSSSTIVESNAISLACYYNEDSSLLSTHSFSVSLFCDTHTHTNRGRFIPSNARVCLCCVSIHFNWIYIVSLFAVVFNSFRRYRQPFISIQTRSVQTKHHHNKQKIIAFDTSGRCISYVLHTFNFYECNPMDFDAYLNFWFSSHQVEVQGFKSNHVHFIIHFESEILMWFPSLVEETQTLFWNWNFEWNILFDSNASKMMTSRKHIERVKSFWNNLKNKLFVNDGK